VHLEQRLKVGFQPGPAIILAADPDQLEQLLINLLRNAVDAVLESKPAGKDHTLQGDAARVKVTWTLNAGQAEITILDDGPGVANPANLFIPFFTTKPGGSGIGLVLSRQIAEAHGGSLVLENRKDRSGCVARLRLPANQESNPARGTN